MVTFFGPGIIWYYFSFKNEECNAPIEESFHLLVVCYFVASIILLIPAMNLCAKKCCFDFCCVPFLYICYLIGKFTLLILMLVNVQNDYARNWNDWDINKCPGLKEATLSWLIINYVMLGCTAVYTVFFIGIAFCDCDYDFDDYDLKY